MEASSPFVDRVKASFTRRPDSPSASSQSKRLSLTKIFGASSSSSRSPKPTENTDSSNPASPQQQVHNPALLPLNPNNSAAVSRDRYHAQSDYLDSHDSSLPHAATLDHNTSHVFSDSSAFDERDMKRRLMDMESSFLPDIPSSESNRALGPQQSSSSPAQQVNKQHGHFRNVSTASTDTPGDSPRPLQFHRPLSYIRNEAGKAQSDSGHPDAPSSLQHSFSSPSADAAQRSRQRQNVQARNTSLLSGAPASNRNSLPPQLEGGTVDLDGLDESDISQDQAPGAGEEVKTNKDNRNSLGAISKDSDRQSDGLKGSNRPDWLRQRQASQRSSGSSILSFGGASEQGFGGSGGATPGSFSTLRPGNRLSRLPSLGSVASSLSAVTDRKRLSSGAPMVAQETNLEPLDEERARPKSPPDTPRHNQHLSADPTQTVLAQHVRDVEVPPTVARRFKETHAPDTSRKGQQSSSPLFGRTKHDLSLKEQNSKIDKLSKENFDLKLKIHYLYQALQDRSDEGVKDMITKNAQLQTDAVKIRKENQSLKKRVRELEREMRTRDDGYSATRTGTGDESEDAISSRDYQQAHLEDEIIYLRDRMQGLEEENERLRLGDATQKLDDRRLAERLRSLDVISNHDEADRLRAELNEEKMARERAELKVEELHMEMNRLENDRSPVREMLMSSQANHNREDSQDAGSLSGTTLVDQLRTENANLRRDLGAQTSMLSSRNRERERLQQEIEDLKLVQRRGELLQPSAASVSGDSILDRSVSRNNLRPTSREGAGSASMSDAEREEFEDREGRLRDENSYLRMRNQDLQKDLDTISYGGEHLANLRDEHDEAIRIMQEERELAADSIDRLEALIEQKDEEVHQLLSDLRAKEDESQALEVEIREISTSLSRVVDDSEARESTIQELQQDLSLANGEIESLEQSLQDVQAAKERLEVQAESSQGEISFLREEQEGDKIKLSDLQSALSRAKANLRGEKEKLRALEELENEAQTARDETRELRKLLAEREQETLARKSSLDDLQGGLRQILGNSQVAGNGLVTQVKRVQRDLDNALRELNRSKATMADRERQLDETRALVDSHTTEAEELHGLLDKERHARRQDRAELERIRHRNNDAGRAAELDRDLKRERQRATQLDEDYQFHLRERSKLMYNVWTRVAALCGSDWLANFVRDQGTEPPTFESVTADPASIDEPLSLALDTVSQNIATSRTRIRATEKELFDSLDSLASSLDERTKRLTGLEKLVHSGAPSVSPHADTTFKEENRILKREIKMLRQANFGLPGLRSPQAELDRTEAAVAKLERERAALHSGANGRPASNPSPTRRPASRALEVYSNTSPDRNDALSVRSDARSTAASTSASHALAANVATNGAVRAQMLPQEAALAMRLQELERRLMKEREARVLDREGARERLKAGKAERDSLRLELERERERTRLRSVAKSPDAEVGRGPRGRRILAESRSREGSGSFAG